MVLRGREIGEETQSERLEGWEREWEEGEKGGTDLEHLADDGLEAGELVLVLGPGRLLLQTLLPFPVTRILRD